MFTGLVTSRGTIIEAIETSGGLRIAIGSSLAERLSDGDSVAVNGVCLTAVVAGHSAFVADVLRETLRTTTLGALVAQTEVNLEPALRLGDRLGGHIVQGHVDGVGTVSTQRDDGFTRIMTIAADPILMRHVVPKGSIAVDGVSLTIARVAREAFDVALIPETLSRTTLDKRRPGTSVNLEVDILAKHVDHLLEPLIAARVG